MMFEGKYCRVTSKMGEILETRVKSLNDNIRKIYENITQRLDLFAKLRRRAEIIGGITQGDTRSADTSTIPGLQFSFAVCIPKPCTIKHAMYNLYGIAPVQFEEQFCRFKGDKVWTPEATIALVIISMLCVITILSTSYDIWYSLIAKKEPKNIIPLGKTFSVYTNTRRLLAFTPAKGTIECVDGIRAIAISWIVVGHTLVTLPPILNSLDALTWAVSFHSFWITSAPIGVDTFFLLSGLLLVYTTVGKLSNKKLLKSLHLFYLHRLLRMFPLLAFTILLQVGVFNYISDGPLWDAVADSTQACKDNWWSTLLYVQNYVKPMCLYHSWYLAVDMQLYILSPLLLYWVLSGRSNIACSSLTIGLLASLTASTVFNFLNNFPASLLQPAATPDAIDDYSNNYYYNTLTRCSPFFVGMCFGYFIHFFRNSKMKLSKVIVVALWIFSLAILLLSLYATEPMKSIDWNNQIVDNLINSFMRPAWALGLGLIIFACSEGYGGPINWFLSLQCWKLPSRISYALYLIHFPLQFVIGGSAIQLFYFSLGNILYTFSAQFVVSFLAAFILTLLVDSPFSTIFKLMLSGGIKSPDVTKQNKSASQKDLLQN